MLIVREVDLGAEVIFRLLGRGRFACQTLGSHFKNVARVHRVDIGVSK
jgi:hypothetical protein